MENQTYPWKTLCSDDLSPTIENLDEIPPLMEACLSGPSPVSQIENDNLDDILGSIIEQDTPNISQLPLLPYQDSENSLNFQENPLSLLCTASDYNSNQLNNRRENECSTWTPWSLNSWLLPKQPTGVGAGLANLGNTCFINAVLQCFTHTVPFVSGLRSFIHHHKPCDSHVNSFCLHCSLHDHIEVCLNSSGGVVSPYKIFDNLNYISPCFQRYQQEDAHEFLQCLLNRLQVCSLDLKPKDDCSSSPDVCLVKQVFGGRLVSRLCCCNCSNISYSYEPFNDLSLEIEDVDTLPSALESFTKVEKIDDLVAQFRCENCKDNVSVEKQLRLDQAPLVATFHLKRFKTEATYVKKIEKRVIFPLELDLQPYTVVNQTSNEELKYQLYAVVKHSGFKPTSGHYVCYIRSSPNMWHNLNDSIVTRVEEEDVISQEAYILFYAREDIPWFSTAIEVQKPGEDPGISDPSPKSVLDDIMCASNLPVENNIDCNADESIDVADKTSIQISCEAQSELELNEPIVSMKEISGLPVRESEFHVPKSVGFSLRDDNPINESTVSYLEENNTNQDIDFISQCPDKCQRGSSVKKWVINRRTRAMRLTKRMPSGRRGKFISLLASQVAGKTKRRR